MTYELCSMSSIYFIVEFPEEVSRDGKPMMDIIPSSWFKSDEKLECYWPVSGNVSTAVKRGQQPDPSTWATCPVRVLGRAGKKILCFLGGGKV